MGNDRYLPPGTCVRYDGLDEGGPEYGIVVNCWFNLELEIYDCFVAFWGDTIPEGEPSEKPYVLRYAAMHLIALPEQFQYLKEM